MSIVLINQYKDTEKQNNKAVQAEFKKNGVNTVIVPGGLSVQWLPGVGSGGLIAVINMASFGTTNNVSKAAEKLKKDLAENDIHAIILPDGASVEVMPV